MPVVEDRRTVCPWSRLVRGSASNLSTAGSKPVSRLGETAACRATAYGLSRPMTLPERRVLRRPRIFAHRPTHSGHTAGKRLITRCPSLANGFHPLANKPMPLELIHVTMAGAFLAVCVLAGDILVRDRREGRATSPLRGATRIDPCDTTPHATASPWHVKRARRHQRARGTAGV